MSSHTEAGKPATRRCSHRYIISSLIWLIYGGCVLMLLGGCPPRKAMEPVPAALSRQEAIHRFNERVRNIAGLKASIRSWQVAYPEEGKLQRHSGNSGTLFYRPPESDGYPRLYLRVDKELIAPEAFVLAGNDRHYWMYSRPASRGWWANHDHLGTDCGAGGVINPLALMDLVGLRPLEERTSRRIGYVVLPETYRFTLARTNDDGLLIHRELTLDRRTESLLQSRVFRADGQLLITAELSDHELTDAGILPTRILLRDDQDGSYLKLSLYRVRQDGRPRDCLFNRDCLTGDLEIFDHIDPDCTTP